MSIIPVLWKLQQGGKFEGILSYIVTSRLAWDTQKEPVSKINN